MKRKRLLWAGGILAGLLVGVPVLLWGSYAVLALLRHEHFYHGMPSSYWRWQSEHWRKGMMVWPAWSRFLSKRVTDYFALSVSPGGTTFFDDPDAGPILCDFVRDRDPRLRLLALQSLSTMRLCPEVAIPALIAMLQDDRPPPPEDRIPYRRLAAMQYLGGYGPKAAPAVPALLDILNRKAREQDGDAQQEQLVALQALRAIEPDNMDLFVRLLEHPDPDIRMAAVGDLGGRFAPRAKPAVPAIVKLLREPYDRIHRAAASALLRIDPEAAHKAGVLKGYE
jgi:hypothetical protein